MLCGGPLKSWLEATTAVENGQALLLVHTLLYRSRHKPFILHVVLRVNTLRKQMLSCHSNIVYTRGAIISKYLHSKTILENAKIHILWDLRIDERYFWAKILRDDCALLLCYLAEQYWCRKFGLSWPVCNPAGGTPHRGLGTFGVDVVAARERKRPQCEN